MPAPVDPIRPLVGAALQRSTDRAVVAQVRVHRAIMHPIHLNLHRDLGHTKPRRIALVAFVTLMAVASPCSPADAESRTEQAKPAASAQAKSATKPAPSAVAPESVERPVAKSTVGEAKHDAKPTTVERKPVADNADNEPSIEDLRKALAQIKRGNAKILVDATGSPPRARQPARAPAVARDAGHAEPARAAQHPPLAVAGPAVSPSTGHGEDNPICVNGTRQSPIHIQSSDTLKGPAEPLQLNYRPSTGTVINTGHTIQVDTAGDNTLTVRGSTYKLVQFHGHHPAEERIDDSGFAMVMHLVHRSADGKLAVLAVLLERGAANPVIEKVWTYMPLDVADRVRMPADSIDVNALLPQDRRYYQFMGSLTTPPCTEGVLWIVLKEPVTLSREQLALFASLFPNNARPVQPLNGRIVREAQ